MLHARVQPVSQTLVNSALRHLIFVVAGASPVLAIAAHAFGFLKMEDAAPFIVVPAVIAATVMIIARVPETPGAVRGLLGGLLGVAAYDAVRIPFVIAGIWPDFIPQMGAWIYGGEGENLLLGYFWRWLGDGGGMGIIFGLACALTNWRKRLTLTGVGYGIFIWSGLIGTIALSAYGSTVLFPITPLNFVASLVGHLVYGSVLGWTYARLLNRETQR
ncbi:hypothetical protein LFM09_00375 [Lentzea alba]|uniref:DUF6789 family protein n=1 Tax=Lentzea alba TaxID=2714351 RepID=UPI0039BEF30A